VQLLSHGAVGVSLNRKGLVDAQDFKQESQVVASTGVLLVVAGSKEFRGVTLDQI
jgi:hypothetical protein